MTSTSEQLGLPPSGERPPVLRLMVVAGVIIAAFFCGIGAWAALAPLDSAAVATGRVTVAGNRKTVQHLEGGIVEELRVTEGDRLEAGQVLIRLDDTQARANLELLRGRHDALLAQEARLMAARDGRGAIAFPPELTAREHACTALSESAGDPPPVPVPPVAGTSPEENLHLRLASTLAPPLPAAPEASPPKSAPPASPAACSDAAQVARLVAGEQAVFDARRRARRGRVDIFHKRIMQLNKEIASLGAQVLADDRRLELIDEERIAVATLVEQGNLDKPRLLALKRAAAQLEGSRGEHEGLIARAEQRIGETELQIIDLQNSTLDQVVSELREVQTQLVDVGERLKAAEDVLERTEIRAPRAGVVMGLNVHTETGVIAPGQHLLDIVPEDDVLVVEAEVEPTDIDVVRVGLTAQVRLTAFKQRNAPLLTGRVSRVSADSFTREQTGATYFLARITIDTAEREKLEGGKLYPGMPAEVMIVTGKQTAFDYILTPVTDSFRLAFRED